MIKLNSRTNVSPERVRRSIQSRFNPIRSLTPESLSRQLDEFHAGNFRSIAQTWEAIERRDDVLQGVASKRKKSVSRLEWEVQTVDSSSEAENQRGALEHFYNSLIATNAIDQNQFGGFPLLVQQMMDAVGKRYAVHEIIWHPASDGGLTGTFRFVPLWFFENRMGRLRFLARESDLDGQEMREGAWMTTVSDGIMESTSVAYIYKNLTLRDWLIYSERNGMPGVKGVTDALPGSPEWELASDAVEKFGAEFHAVMNRGTEIEAIDMTAKGNLPYPELVERMDRMIAALWRGADLSTISAPGGVGASLQRSETVVLETSDAKMISETLNAQVDRFIIRHLFNTDNCKAHVRLKTSSPQDITQDLKIFKELWSMGAPLSMTHIFERFGIPLPRNNEVVLEKNKMDEAID